MESEARIFIESLSNATHEKIFDLTFHCGTIERRPVVVVQCGIGKVNAGRVSQLMIDKFNPQVIINSGVAGGVSLDLHVNDVVIADGLIEHDFDLRGFGKAKGYVFWGDDITKPSIFETDRRTSNALRVACEKALGVSRVHIGRIVSGDQFISSSEIRNALHAEYAATAVEMEGAAVAHVCSLCGVPFAILRTISDLADGSATESDDEVVTNAAAAARIAIEAIKLL